MGTNEGARFVYGRDELAPLWQASRDAREAPRQRRKIQLDISDYGAATEIGALLGRRIRHPARISVDLVRLDEILREQRFGMGLDDVLELVHERPLMRRRTADQERMERRQQQMQLLLGALDAYGLCGHKWVDEWMDLVLQRSQDNLANLAPEVSRILAALNLDPETDPSEWRDDRALGIPGNRSTVTRMVLRAAAIAHGLDYPESSEDRRLLWERCGVREHSRSVSIAAKPQSLKRGRDKCWRDGWYSGQEVESPSDGTGDFAFVPDRSGEVLGDPGPETDLFISHASEDKSVIVKRLAEELREAGVEVWYDDFSLSAGDSLRESIDHGIATSSLGLVVLSHNFFRKNWARQELAPCFRQRLWGVGV
ncbi:TIR domain-containing protein [Saccharopolyspora aridisoli]|uniref:TIR domain-containing protein n=1 Tax=Saccharopolyspora aridisoli TaxID=2530385 RepID=A0A4R4UGX2_9PSEU|nr:TIGR02679 domain-containing protein [Saccharopolyspora aridisoli]TDC89296.1 TIR domain-containing protein [Saccharopolyspora aridisoli]